MQTSACPNVRDSEPELIPDVEGKIINLRGQQVILDCDVADLYGVQTKEINQAVKNNPRKFPEGYIFELDSQEKIEVVKNFDHLQNLRFSPQLPKAFTERGLYMLATMTRNDTTGFLRRAFFVPSYRPLRFRPQT